MSDGVRDWLVVPIKPAVGGKQRLAAHLRQDERELLSHRLADRLLHCAVAVWPRERVLVVGGDAWTRTTAGRLAVVCLDDPGAGQSAAVRQGAEFASAHGAQVVATVAADLLRVEAADLAQLRRAGERPEPRFLIAVPDREGSGTNALVVRPAGLDVYRFGPNSAGRHREVARQLGLDFHSLAVAGLAWDVDRLADLDDPISDPRRGRAAIGFERGPA